VLGKSLQTRKSVISFWLRREKKGVVGWLPSPLGRLFRNTTVPCAVRNQHSASRAPPRIQSAVQRTQNVNNEKILEKLA
jgi:hypothetical protein